MHSAFVLTAFLATASPLFAQQVAATLDHPVEVSAGPSQGAITVRFEGTPLRRAVRSIIEQAKMDVTYSTQVIPADIRVTYTAVEVSGMRALMAVLSNSGVRVVAGSGTSLKLVREDAAAQDIHGVVRDEQTKQPLRGVTVTLDGATRGVVTKEDGVFRLTGVTPGTHRVSMRMLGYTKVSKSVEVAEDGSVSVDIEMRVSANTLDQVVVTGTVTATELKAIPNAITVITAKQIEQRGITKIEQLFRGDIPGLVALNNGVSSDGRLEMYSRGVSSAGTGGVARNTIKTYVDGVELADPTYVSQIDPSRIERIEVLTGPQASTIYGANALNGVMQIFTKRGSGAKPQVTLNVNSALVENSSSAARAPRHYSALDLTGLDGRTGYSAGGSWAHESAWVPQAKTTSLAASGGTHTTFEPGLGTGYADFTFLRNIRRNDARGAPSQRFLELWTDGWFRVPLGFSRRPMRNTTSTQSLGATFSYTPVSFWSNQLNFGQDFSSYLGETFGQENAGPSDTVAYYRQQWRSERRQITYSTTAQIPLTTFAHAVVTAGADEWQSVSEGGGTGGVTVARSTLPLSTESAHNAGGFLQTQLGIRDQLFLTYGLRAEWNPRFGPNAQPNLAADYGMAFTQSLGNTTTKLRGSFGRSTRPPDRGAIAGTQLDAVYWPAYGDAEWTKANPNLRPEYHQGIELGADVYIGSPISFGITRFDQKVDGLIAGVISDSVRSLLPYPYVNGYACATNVGDWHVCDNMDAEGYGYMRQAQNLNLLDIRNQGWEFRGTGTVGPFTAEGTYTWTKSRSLGVPRQYQSQFSWNPFYQRGASPQNVPDRVWSTRITYAQSRTSIMVHISGIGRITSFGDDQFKAHNLFDIIRLDNNRSRMDGGWTYVSHTGSYTTADVIISHRLSRSADLTAQIQNVTNSFQTDNGFGAPTIGRQTQLGFRLRW